MQPLPCRARSRKARVRPSPYFPSASLHAERLRKARFRHTAHAACIWSYRRIIQEGMFNVARARVGRFHAVSHSWKQEEEASAQRLRCQHAVGWWSHRIILALQDQRRNGAPDRLLLYRRDRFHPPELTDRESIQAKVEQCRPDLRRKPLNGCLQSVLRGESHIFTTLYRIEQSSA